MSQPIDERIWDSDYRDCLFVSEVSEGLRVTVDKAEDQLSIDIPPAQVRKLRLALQAYERRHK